MDDKSVAQDRLNEGAARKAEELMEAAAYAPEGRGRLWRLEWAQAFRKLADLGQRNGSNGQDQG